MQRPLMFSAIFSLFALAVGCGPDDGPSFRFECDHGRCTYCDDQGCIDASWHSACDNSSRCGDEQICVQGGCCWTCTRHSDCPAQQSCRPEGFCAEDGYAGPTDGNHQPGCAAGEVCEVGEGEGEGEGEGVGPEGEGAAVEGEGEPVDGGVGVDCDYLPPLPERCRYNAECPEGFSCVNSKCTQDPQ